MNSLNLITLNMWQPLLNQIAPFFSDSIAALKIVSVSVVLVVLIWTKIKEIWGDQQEEQMLNKKTKTVLFAFVFIFLASTIVEILQKAFS